jgi:hypothetical protein
VERVCLGATARSSGTLLFCAGLQIDVPLMVVSSLFFIRATKGTVIVVIC